MTGTGHVKLVVIVESAVNAPAPLVSIVTPTLNSQQFLAEAIDSILSQDYPAIELIVVDGGSTDTTLDTLARYGERLRVISGRDKGPSDAIYKGFQQATGEIFAWLNADDSFLPGAMRTAVDYLNARPETDVVYGEGWWIDEHGKVISRYPTLPWDPRILERDCFICQPAAFLRATAYRRCPLDPDVNRSFDYDLWIRMARLGVRFDCIPDYLANSRMHSGAKTLSEREEVFQASMHLLERHYGYIPFPWVFGYTAWRRDRRDQFFEPLQPTIGNYLAALPMGLRLNPARPLRFFGEWLRAPLRRYLSRT
jgi:glycosyltransferase involved in cell wall biosynthesis